jgi:2-oxoglutarate/2-oxoacid ferredoxin oxidoreductase subunit beta
MAIGETDLQPEDILYQRPESLTDTPMRYCPGCTHGIAHRLVAEVIDELGLRDRTIAVASVGCSVYAYEYFNMDSVQASHGRAPAVATGIKRVRPDATVFTYQGDGDLASIGLAEVMHAAARAESITVVFINNAVYGMTRGQMAPTTLMGQRTTTSTAGRSVEHGGFPMDICAIMEQLPGVAYLAREALMDPRHVMKARQSLLKAFRTQVEGRGFSLVELLSTCPTWWYKDPLKSMDHIKQEIVQQYPLGVFRDPFAEA